MWISEYVCTLDVGAGITWWRWEFGFGYGQNGEADSIISSTTYYSIGLLSKRRARLPLARASAMTRRRQQ